MKTFNHSVADLQSPSWRATYVLRPELAVLAQSLHQYGWLMPLVVRQQTMELIDGYHRWLAVKTDKTLTRKMGREIPCILVKCDETQAMMMHLQLNRGRGLVSGEGTSHIVRELLKSRRYTREQLRHVLAMSSDEISLMIDSTLIKHLNIPSHNYSKAWVPIEAPAGVTEVATYIERPPNADR